MIKHKNTQSFALCIMSMLLMQVGLAYSIPIIRSTGAIHTSAYRLTVAALIVTVVCASKKRKKIRRLFNADTFLLGIAMAGMAIFFSIAIANMPLALATCIEFMPPLAVVCLYQKTTRSLMLVGGALLGIYLMLANTQEHEPATHIWSAFAAASCWAGYIVFGKRVSQNNSSMYGICPALLTAACTSLIFSAWEPGTTLSIQEVPQILLIALLYPLAPYILDLLALKTLKHSTFGMLTSAEPVLALAIGVITLGQTLTYFQLAGLSLVVFANAASLTEPKRAEEV
ncbi:EamA family transporter [Pseudomonas bohemica]|uniref:EamA family transporter n=1 Tax=Pseudomonas bohemica TaxID=2044872 RepID=UPI000DA5F9DD|nr:EamA family transporter [Pseudomonas bohemica]